MCLVIYAWLVQQDYFKELTDQDVRKRLYDEQKNQIEQDMSPFGFISDAQKMIPLLMQRVIVGRLMNTVIVLLCGSTCNDFIFTFQF